MRRVTIVVDVEGDPEGFGRILTPEGQREIVEEMAAHGSKLVLVKINGEPVFNAQ